MPFGNLQLHIPGASRSEAARPGAGRPEARRHEASPRAARQGDERSRSLARGSSRDTPSVASSVASSVAPQTGPVRESSDAFRGKSQTDLSVVTAEGDRITISLAAQVRYAASSQTGPDGSSQIVETASSSQLRVDVQGDLSEAELKDLRTLLNKLSQAPTEASSTAAANQPPASSADPGGFAGLSSLAAFRYRSQQTIEASSLVNIRG